MPLTIQSRRVGHVAVLDCSGRIVAGEEASALNRTVNGHISNHTNVVINLGEVTFIDSSGLGLLPCRGHEDSDDYPGRRLLHA